MGRVRVMRMLVVRQIMRLDELLLLLLWRRRVMIDSSVQMWLAAAAIRHVMVRMWMWMRPMITIHHCLVSRGQLLV